MGLGFTLFIIFCILAFIFIDDFIGDFLFALGVASFIGGILITFLLSSNDEFYTFKDQVLYETPIYSLETSPGIKGGFVIGIGVVYPDANYYFYIKNEDGEYELRSVSSSQCSIIETDKEKPFVRKVEKKAEFKSILYEYIFGINLRSFFPEQHYYLYVPPNTVKKIYSANISH